MTKKPKPFVYPISKRQDKIVRVGGWGVTIAAVVIVGYLMLVAIAAGCAETMNISFNFGPVAQQNAKETHGEAYRKDEKEDEERSDPN